jgi:hypothetical protein
MIAAFARVQHRLTDENNTEDSGFDFTEENYKIVKTILAKYPKNYKQASCLMPVSCHFSAAFAASNVMAVLTHRMAATPLSTRRRLVLYRRSGAGMIPAVPHLTGRWAAHAPLRMHVLLGPTLSSQAIHVRGHASWPVR